MVTLDGVTRYADIYNYSLDGTEPPGDSLDARLDRWILAYGPPFASLFGWMSMEVKKENEPGSIRNASQPLNTVFRHGRRRLLELMLNLNKLFLAGLPLVYTLRDLEVLQNPFWGTTSYNCHLTIICYYLPHKFGQVWSCSAFAYAPNTSAFTPSVLHSYPSFPTQAFPPLPSHPGFYFPPLVGSGRLDPQLRRLRAGPFGIAQQWPLRPTVRARAQAQDRV
jgi:hypothetical protein